MFTGIVTDIGGIVSASRTDDGMTARIGCSYPSDSFEAGCSICCSGCCLTVTEFGSSDGQSWFETDISNETLALTTLGQWADGSRVNLERSMTPSSELGGHLVTGHVDGLAEIVDLVEDGDSIRFELLVPPQLAPFIAKKGSVTLDGTSLTINEVDGANFSINLIPHTLEVTTWGDRAIGDKVNLEVDLIARYVARLLSHDTADPEI